jgi:hypothetical protein
MAGKTRRTAGIYNAVTTKPLANPLSYICKTGVIAFIVTGTATLSDIEKSISSSDPWIAKKLLSFTKGKGTLKYTVAANPGNKTRQGSITIVSKWRKVGAQYIYKLVTWLYYRRNSDWQRHTELDCRCQQSRQVSQCGAYAG